MTEKEKMNEVFYKMEDEGFHYCFAHYSSWREIEDEKFHELRTAYLQAANALENYVYNNSDEL